MKRLFLLLAEMVAQWLARNCEHPGHRVAFDVHEGAHEPHMAQYCYRCGSLRLCTGDVGRGVVRAQPWRGPVSP
jgi:hypothetical protein